MLRRLYKLSECLNSTMLISSELSFHLPEPKQKPGSRFLQLTIFSGVSLLLLFVLTFLFRAKDK